MEENTGSRRSSSLKIYYQSHEKDIEEYISDTDDDEMHNDLSNELYDFLSFSNSEEKSDEDKSRRKVNISFMEMWETLREDISELQEEGLIEKESVLARMVEMIESIQMDMSTDFEGTDLSWDDASSISTDGEEDAEKRMRDEEIWAMEEKEQRFVMYDESDFKEDGQLNDKKKDVRKEDTGMKEKEERLIAYDEFGVKEDGEMNEKNVASMEDIGFEVHSPTEDSRGETARRKTTQTESAEICDGKVTAVRDETESRGENLGVKNFSKNKGMNERKCAVIREGEMEYSTDERKELVLNKDHVIETKNVGNMSLKNEMENLSVIPDKNVDLKISKRKGEAKSTDSEEDEKYSEGVSDEFVLEENRKAEVDGRQERAECTGKGQDSMETVISRRYEENLMETWYYDEIDGNEEVCKEEESSGNRNERVCKYPLTRQQKMERSYEIRKERAWRNWLAEKDKEKRRKALLEIQNVMLAQSNKKKKIPSDHIDEEKRAEAQLRDRQQREKEISERVALENKWWKRKMKDWKKQWKVATEVAASKRRQRFIIPPPPPTKFDSSKKGSEGAIPHQSISEELKTVKELPIIESSYMENQRFMEENKSHKRTVKAEENENMPEEGKKDEEEMEVKDEKIIENREESYKEWLAKKAVKLFNPLEFPCSLADRVNKFDWIESTKKWSVEKITMGNFQVTPKVVIFKDFIPKMTYRQRITIRNLEMHTRQLYIVGLWYSSESLFGQGILEFDEGIGNLPRLVCIRPGLTFDVWLVFKPRSVADSTAVSAQVALLIAQGPLLAGRDKWARLNRASNPDKVKDAGYILISVQCRDARPEPQMTHQVFFLDIYPQDYEDDENKLPIKEITIRNKGALDTRYQIIKVCYGSQETHMEPQFMPEETFSALPMQPKKSQSIMSKKSKASIFQKKKAMPRGCFTKKIKLSSDIQRDSEISNQTSSSTYVARRTVDDIFDLATSCFSCSPQFFGILRSHSSVKLTVKLRKVALTAKETKFMEKYILYFDNNSKIPEIHIWICYRHCETVDKISVNKKSIDFGICTAGAIYQDFVEVCNDYGFSRGIILSLSDFPDKQETDTKNPLHPHTLRIVPKGLTFVQPHSSFSFAVRLVVGKSDENLNNKFLPQMKNNDELSFELEMYTMIPEPQKSEHSNHLVKSLLCRIKASAILSDIASNPECFPLVLEPPILNIGQCLTTETIKANFKIISNSRITLTYGFLGLPKYVVLQPGYGFGRILPGETLPLDLFYSPLPDHGSQSPGKKFTFQLMCYDVLNKARPNFTTAAKMKVEANVIHIPDLHLSCSIICFPATPCGSFSTTSITLTSTQDISATEGNEKCKIQSKFSSSMKPSECLTSTTHTKSKHILGYWYEFQPQSEYIFIAPCRGYIRPGQRVKLRLFFKPKLNKSILENKAKEMWEEDKNILAEMELEKEKKLQEDKNNLRKGKKKKKEKMKSEKDLKDDKITPHVSQIKSLESTSALLTAANARKYDKTKNQSQNAFCENEALPDEVAKLMINAEKSLLENFVPYLSYIKIACLVVKSHPPDDGDGMREFSINKYPEDVNKTVNENDFTQDSPATGCTWFKPPKEIVPEVLWIEAICPVVRPGFLVRECGEEWIPRKQGSKRDSEVNLHGNHQEKVLWSHLKTSHGNVVDFGVVAINGGSLTLAITLQNISSSSSLHMSPIPLLDPLGSFFCPYSLKLPYKEESLVSSIESQEMGLLNKKNRSSMKYDSFVVVPPEHILRIPVTFTPEKDGKIKEFLNIKGKTDQGIATQIAIQLIGKGELPNFTIHPNPPTVTLRQQIGKTPKPSTIKIQNLCDATLDFYIGKVVPITETEKIREKGGKVNKIKELPIKEQEKKSSPKGKRTMDKDENLLKTGKKKKYPRVKHEEKRTKVDEKEGLEETEDNSEMSKNGIKGEECEQNGKNEKDETIRKSETSTEAEQMVFSVDPPDFLRVNALSAVELKIFLHPGAEKMKKSFRFPLTLFGKGLSVSNVTVQVISK